MGLKFDTKTGEWVGTTGGVDLQKLEQKSKSLSSKASARKRSEERQAELKAQNDAHYRYGYAKRVVNYIADVYGAKLADTVFRNGGSYYQHSVKQIVFDYADIDNVYENGYGDYVTVAPTVARVMQERYTVKRSRWSGRSVARFESIRGKKAIAMVALHEFAHYLQCSAGERTYRGMHNESFHRHFAELLEIVDWNEIENL